ncbi:hypothetical protein [Flavobacterium sp. Root186]|uniref:hypothetical protein n=1 Tax=Flavobacterium sp. Root186 TaxID=1736485 RepID=UPI0006FCAA03|nr:hypothetical protein [Flavobacterium sp. Root186]KRB55615.1 hypothetical protein ASD98_13195 [Flavobacterium sp. Root186]
MSAINTKLAIILLSSIMLHSCKKEEKISNQKVNKENIQSKIKEDNDETVRTVTLFSFNNENNTEVIKISGSDAGDEDDFYLGGAKNIIIASKYKKNLELIKNDTLVISEYNHVVIDPKYTLRKKIQGVDYFLFAIKESPLGNGDPEIYLSFIMLNTNSLKFYALKYIGEYTLRSGEFVDGEFTKDKILESNTAVYNELYQFGAKSKWIYKPTEEEKDINFYKNFEEKWNEDNYPEGKESSYPTIVKSTYYGENLFEFNGEYDKDQVIENNDFKIVSYFRNNIIGYDKNKKLYFPIAVESCHVGCDKEIKFISENEIEISHETDSERPDIINLSNIEFANNQF